MAYRLSHASRNEHYLSNHQNNFASNDKLPVIRETAKHFAITEVIEIDADDDDDDSDNVDDLRSSRICDSPKAKRRPKLWDLDLWSSSEESDYSSVPLLSRNFGDFSLTSPPKRALTPVNDVKQKTEEDDDVIHDVISEKDADGDNLLMIAIICLDFRLCFILLNFLTSHLLLGSCNNLLQTALHLAVLVESAKLTRRLLVAGSPVDFRDLNGDTALHIACKRGLYDIAESLLRPVNFSETEVNKYVIPYQKIPQEMEIYNCSGLTCFLIAAKNSDKRMLDLLLSTNANVNARELKTGKTALHIAAEGGNSSLVKYLLNVPNIDINCRSYNGATPLELASLLRHNNDVVFQLLYAGADPKIKPLEVDEPDYSSCESDSDSASDLDSDEYSCMDIDVDEWINTTC